MSESPEQIQQAIDRSREEAARKIDQIGTHVEEATSQARNIVNRDMPDMLHEGLDAAKAELKEDLTQASMGSVAIAGGAVVGVVGGVFLLQSLMELLAQRLPRWQAAGVMGLGLTGTALALGLGGKQQLKPDRLKPTRTMALLQQAAARTKAQTRSLRSKAAAGDPPSSMPEATASQT